jgi:hypothetical protein
MMNGKGFERNRSWPNLGIVPTFVWTNWGNPQNVPVKVASTLAEIRTQHFPNTHLDFCRYTNTLGESKIQLLPKNLIATRETTEPVSQHYYEQEYKLVLRDGETFR